MGEHNLTLNQDKRRRFDSYPGSNTAVQGLTALVERLGSGRDFTLRCALVAEAEMPLPEPEGEREWVWVTGQGWFERPVEVPEPIVDGEVAAA